MNGFPKLSLGGLPQLLIQTVNGLIAVRPRVLKVDQSTMSLTDHGDGTATIASTGGGGGNTLTVGNGPGSATILKGTPVQWYDAASGRPTVAPVTNTGITPMLGMLTEDLVVGGSANCQTGGVVIGLATHTFLAGDFLWVDSSGGLTTVQAGTFPHFVGEVTVSDATNGAIFLTRLEDGGDLIPPHGHGDGGNGGSFGSVGTAPLPRWVETSTPSAAPSGQQTVFIDVSDHKLKRIDSSNVVTIIG